MRDRWVRWAVDCLWLCLLDCAIRFSVLSQMMQMTNIWPNTCLKQGDWWSPGWRCRCSTIILKISFHFCTFNVKKTKYWGKGNKIYQRSTLSEQSNDHVDGMWFWWKTFTALVAPSWDQKRTIKMFQLSGNGFYCITFLWLRVHVTFFWDIYRFSITLTLVFQHR